MSKILLVDDVDLFLELERSYLEGYGYDFFTASSGEEAVRRINNVVPDMLLLDYSMPGINGDEVCRLIRENPQLEKIPILMVTAAGKPEEVQNSLNAGCDDYIAKPVNKDELCDKVSRLLGRVPRRVEERISVKLPIQLHEGGRLHVVTSKDISSSGVCLESLTPLAKNTTVEMTLESPDGEKLSLYGKIKWSSEQPGDPCGVYFIYPDLESKKRLDCLH